MPRRPAIGQPAPRFELAAHATPGAPGDDADAGHWSLEAHLGRDRAVVLIFHRHIH